jgi:hypothetical protein
MKQRPTSVKKALGTPIPIAIWSDLERPESDAVLLCDGDEVEALKDIEMEFESVTDAKEE